ncbi:MAG: hypothetical protein AMXMBFR84_06090 [Candidatus Hydrogenedentota bacterium]
MKYPNRIVVRWTLRGAMAMAACMTPCMVWAQAPAEPPPLTAPTVMLMPTLQEGTPQQVSVSVKVVEFQATKGVETGFSAYFARRNKTRPWGRVSSGNGAITTADLSFPMDAEAAITVFLDKIRMSEGDLEFVLQALANENKAFILSQPKQLVRVRSAMPSVIKTVQENPYEQPVVVGQTIIGTTAFRNTGVTLEVFAPDVIDDDLDWNTTEDTYVRLVLRASVNELGENLIIAVDDRIIGADQISAPSFVSRSIETEVWVRNGQVLILGGLYRNRKIKQGETVPWLAQAEDLAVGVAERLIPGNLIGSPLTSTIGARASEEQRRELVFFIKAEIWRPSFTVADEMGFDDDEKEEEKEGKRPTDVIGEVIEGVGQIPKGIAEGIAGDARPGPTKVEQDLSGEGLR